MTQGSNPEDHDNSGEAADIHSLGGNICQWENFKLITSQVFMEELWKLNKSKTNLRFSYNAAHVEGTALYRGDQYTKITF